MYWKVRDLTKKKNDLVMKRECYSTYSSCSSAQLTHLFPDFKKSPFPFWLGHEILSAFTYYLSFVNFLLTEIYFIIILHAYFQVLLMKYKI